MLSQKPISRLQLRYIVLSAMSVYMFRAERTLVTVSDANKFQNVTLITKSC